MLLIKNQKSLFSIMLISILILIVINMVLFYQFDRQNKRNESTHCLDQVEHKHIFIIDKSSPMSLQTQEEILSRIKQQISRIQQEDFILVYQITSDSLMQLKPIFQACKTDANFEKNLLQKARTSIYSNFDNTLTSPLAEALLDINLSHYQMDAQRTNIYIYSDLLQNSRHLSLAQTPQLSDAIEQFKATRLGGIQRPTFINTFVHLHIIPRAQLTEQLVKNRDGFWIWFLGDMRGDRQSYGLERHDLPGSYTQ
ncbi:hypothetical protein [Acinetobacter sp. ANC 5378]|uniref:hypothetical protein n=1 Tax=Acinetobacter sp. ANC 5378 TaxID=2731249 RepID=UPI0014902B20|nr:hypothetical protein [Acinetobacter sp. ANC 5378]NNG81416.1 hypothetical protein [Acinetobacter sp. ANC 5378]